LLRQETRHAECNDLSSPAVSVEGVQQSNLAQGSSVGQVSTSLTLVVRHRHCHRCRRRVSLVILAGDRNSIHSPIAVARSLGSQTLHDGHPLVVVCVDDRFSQRAFAVTVNQRISRAVNRDRVGARRCIPRRHSGDESQRQ